MRFWKIIAVATVAEGAAVAGLGGLAGLVGGSSGWLDLVNNFAPVWLAIAILCAPAAALLMEPGPARRAILTLALAGGLVSGAQVLPELAAAITPIGAGSPEAKRVRIVTFNTWSENKTPRAVTDRVLAANPDAAALIEMSWDLHKSGLKALALAYPYRTLRKGDCPWDMVLLSRRPFSSYGCQVAYTRSRPDLLATVVWGRTTAPDGRPFMLATTHYTWPFPRGGQSFQRVMLARFVRQHSAEDLILTGDFNLTPWMAALRGQDRDLRPLTRRTHAIFTWPAMIGRLDRPAPVAFLPIDHIYAAPSWRTERVERLARAGSDHFGIVADFSRKP